MALSLTVAVAVLSLGPQVAESPAGPVNDKVLHALAYAALTAAYLAATRGRIPVVVLGVTACGVVLELAQLVLPSRTSEVWDVVANLTGVAVVALWARAWRVGVSPGVVRSRRPRATKRK